MGPFVDRLEGALYGQAIGDAMGGPVEGWPPGRILDRFEGHDFGTFLPPTHGGDPSAGKGSGRVTDDTLMAEALVFAYQDSQDHLDAYGYAEYLLPHVKGIPVWVPERQREMDLWDRVFFPEKYPWLRLTFSNADPRTAGVGNMVNCGVAMWTMPVGAVNAGDPRAAYQEAAALGAAHNESFAVEAGAVMAAVASEALSPGSSIDGVLQVARDLARDGTHEAIVAAVGAADTGDDLRAFIANVRRAVAPYDQREGHVDDGGPMLVASVGDVGRPSRVMSIEELPVALAALKYGDGDFIRTLRSSVCYGRDCDSIAAMACCLYGAVFGAASLPASLCSTANQANRRDFGALAHAFAETVLRIFEKHQQDFEGKRRAILAGSGGG